MGGGNGLAENDEGGVIALSFLRYVCFCSQNSKSLSWGINQSGITE